jgi:hypothetical protein
MMAGKLVAPYAQFQFSALGQFAMAVQAMKRNPGIGRKLLPLVAQQGLTVLMGGLRGMIAWREVGALFGLVNTIWENQYKEKGPLPDINAWLLNNKVAGDFLMFGGMGALSKRITKEGIDLTQSAGSPTAESFAESVYNPRIVQGLIEAGAHIPTIV